MPRWIIQLVGERFDLEDLPKWFHDDSLKVELRGDEYFLSSARLVDLSKARDVLHAALDIVAQVNGSIRLWHRNHRPVAVGAVYREHENGRRDAFAFIEGVEARTGIATKFGPAPLARWLRLAESRPNVKSVLSTLHDGQQSWAELYNVFEVIQWDVGGDMISRGWTTQAEGDRFTGTANSFELTGMKGRHAGRRMSPPRKPMSPEEAQTFVMDLAQRWLEHLERGDSEHNSSR